MILRILEILLVIAFFSSSPALCASATSYASAVIIKTSDFVEIKYTTSERWFAARPGDKLYKGDAVRTGTKGKAQLRFNDGSQLLMMPMAKITVISKDNEIKLDFGKIFASVLKGGAGFRASVPFATASVLGTVLELDYSSSSLRVSAMNHTSMLTFNGIRTKIIPSGLQLVCKPTGFEELKKTNVAVMVNENKIPLDFWGVGIGKENKPNKSQESKGIIAVLDSGVVVFGDGSAKNIEEIK